MKVSFDSITLGGGPNYYLDDNFGSWTAKLNHQSVKIPRSDYGKSLTSYLDENIKVVSGTLVGTNVTDWRDKKLTLLGKLNNSYTFTITDDYTSGGTTTTYATYEFTGKVINVDVSGDVRSNKSKYSISIYCDDPNIYVLPAVTDSTAITVTGFVFPLVFPFVFSGSTASLTISNIGHTTIYPDITLTGAGTNFTIRNETNTDLDNQNFQYDATLVSSETVNITPTPDDPIKIRKNSVSQVQFTNSNWDVLKCPVGTTILTFFAESNIDANTQADISYRIPYVGI